MIPDTRKTVIRHLKGIISALEKENKEDNELKEGEPFYKFKVEIVHCTPKRFN